VCGVSAYLENNCEDGSAMTTPRHPHYKWEVVVPAKNLRVLGLTVNCLHKVR